MTGRYKGQILTAIGVDCNNQIVPLAFAFVENENLDSWCIRHMSANFYDHFKNKDLKNMFKRLCIQNQQRKFNALWQILD